MKPPYRYCIRCLACLVLIASAHPLHADPAETERGAYPDPARFERDIARFEQADAESMPPERAVLFVGSSSIRFWHEHLTQDMAPLTVVGRGFGGSTMYDLLHYADRVIFPYKPRAIVIYEGDNDISEGVEPEKIIETFDALLAKVHEELPDCRIYMLSIKPSNARWSLWPKIERTNAMFAQRCAADERLIYIDLATPLLGEDGRPVAALFQDDQLHLNREGYKIWRDTLAPMLVQAEQEHEPQDQPEE